MFVLNSRATHEFGADEDELPPNGNPHPANPHFLNQQNHNGQAPGFFEDVGDLNEVQQENINEGWEVPPPPKNNNNNGWGQWVQQEGELVGENEQAAVNQLADAIVANVVMQN